MVSLVSAETVKLSWTNPTTYDLKTVEYPNGVPLSAADAAAIITVVEVKEKSATTWTEIAQVTNAGTTVNYIVASTYVRGQTLQFRAKSRLVKNTTNYDSASYSDTVDWFYPYLAPGRPTTFTITLTLANATTATISVGTK